MDNIFITNSKRHKVSKADKNLLRSIQQAKLDMETASGIFNTCLDSRLIEIAIYEENIAKTRLDYLIREAKTRGVRFNIEDYKDYYEDDDDDDSNSVEQM
ncbi:MAG: YaaL family protein [Inconstantimicrobium porci]|uniref:DUF2508 family protein n=1 Tax=Inconstantimicrobium porci TaxID=2652291 RepID=A0A7X2N022_9CLOT|nr:YaaL family protein [Inconstantimicrobium porci]MDY5912633.1 YaaL family protein [Inconstantimicrobium porci]MSR92247.1 DUF2508 family protein [Inconstantimicrobium porci]